MAAFALSVIVNEYPIGQVSFSCFDYFAYEPESQIIIVCVRQICFFSYYMYMLCQQIISFNPLFSLICLTQLFFPFFQRTF